MRLNSITLLAGGLMLAILLHAGACLAQDKQEKYETVATTYSERGRIVVLREDEKEIEVAPGKYVAFAGTQYRSITRSVESEDQHWKIKIRGDSVGKAVIPRSIQWGVSKDPRTWSLMGVCALKKGTSWVILTPKEGTGRRTLTIKVKDYPRNWEKKVLEKLGKHRVSYEFKDADFETFAKQLAKETRVSIVADYFCPELKEKKITYKAVGEPAAKVLDNALKTVGLEWFLVNNRVLITKKDVTEIIKLDGIIVRALEWLKRHQSDDGSFSAAKFSEKCTGKDKCSGPGSFGRDIAVTGLALLAFTGNGHTHRVGSYKKTVATAKDYLVKCMKDDGSFGEAKGRIPMLDSLVGTLALCELLAVTRDAKLKEYCQKAVGFLMKSQRKDGGWGWYSGLGIPNTVATAMGVLALKAAKTAGIEIPAEVFAGAARYFESMTGDKGWAGYDMKGNRDLRVETDNLFTMQVTPTAASCIGSIFCGVKRTEKRLKQGADFVMSYLPRWQPGTTKGVDPLYWYLGTYSVFHQGGKHWQNWQPLITQALLPNQEKKGCAAGSWKPVGKFTGRVFSTALNTLSAEIAFRYLRALEMLKYEGK
jgi:hypothetical protein